jgi:hypothetical protein
MLSVVVDKQARTELALDLDELVREGARRMPAVAVAEVLPLLYLHGLSGLDFVPALERFFGAAAGLSASVVTHLTIQWQAERRAFLERSLTETTCTAGRQRPLQRPAG